MGAILGAIVGIVASMLTRSVTYAPTTPQLVTRRKREAVEMPRMLPLRARIRAYVPELSLHIVSATVEKGERVTGDV